MGRVRTNNEIKIRDLQDQIDDLMSVIPHCKTRADANSIQDEIYDLESEIETLESIESEVCPECGDYLRDDMRDDLTCHNDYHYD